MGRSSPRTSSYAGSGQASSSGKTISSFISALCARPLERTATLFGPRTAGATASSPRSTRPPSPRNALPCSGRQAHRTGGMPLRPPDLSVIALRLTLLEDRLAEALKLLGTHLNNSRLRRRRYSLRSSSRTTRRRRQRGTALREKSFDLAC